MRFGAGSLTIFRTDNGASIGVLSLLAIRRSTYSSRAAQTDFLKVLVLAGLISLVLTVSIFAPYLGICSLGLLLASLVIGINLRWAVLCFLFLLPFDPQFELKPGLYLYFDLLFVLPALVYLWQVVFGKLHIHWASLALGPYLLFADLTTFWRAENGPWFSAYSVRLAIAVLFMAVIAGICRSETVTLVLGTTLVPQVLYGLYQLVTGDLGMLFLLLYPHYQSQPWTDRAYGFFFQPNNFGGYCAIISVMLLALGLRSKTARGRIACYALASFGFIGVASSGSRGAWFGAISGLVLPFNYSRANLGAKIVLAGAALAGVVLAISLQYAPLERVESFDTFTIEGRTTMSLAALLLFLQHPLIGVGLTNYQVLMSNVVDWIYDAGNAAHNTYLQILSENGIIGFLLFFGPLFYLFYRNLKRAKESTAALLISTGLTVFFVHSLFDFQFTTAPQYLLLFAILFGLASKTVLEPAAVPDGKS